MHFQKVRLEIHAANLTNVAGAFNGTSDPYAVVTLLASDPNAQPRILGKTEVIKNSLNPRWITCFDIDYSIGQLTRINVGIYDEVKQGTHKSMGSATFEVGEVLGSRGSVKAKQLRSGGTLFVRIKSAPTTDHGMLHLRLIGHQLKNVDGIFGKSNPFFEVSCRTDAPGGLSWQPIYRSQPIKGDLNPRWPPCSLNIGRLCNGDFTQPIQVKVYDWQKNGKHTWMGTFETQVNALLAAVVPEPPGKQVDTSKAFTIIKKGRLVAGQVVVTEARIDGMTASGSTIYSHAPPQQSAAPSYISPTTATTSSISYLPAMQPPALYVPLRQQSTTPMFSQALDQPPPSYATPTGVVAAKKTFSSQYIQPPAPQPLPQYALSPLQSPPPPYAPLANELPLPPPLAPPEQKPSFVEYLSGGLQIEMCIAIDFTGSNGDPRQPSSLHYMDPQGQFNDYEKAITAVGGILGRYDPEQKFPVFGFGAKFGGQIQHCFQVGKDTELHRLPSVLSAYRNVFSSGLTMSGPTVFAEVINMAAAKARSTHDYCSRVGQQKYTLLLILTDGEVSDIDLTKQSLHAASDAPLSVVIVGIGAADFSAMHFLDNFQANAGGKHRDVCKFVEFNKYQNDKQALTRATLHEIPDQVAEYFWSRGIKPLPPIQGSQMNLLGDAPTEEDVELNMTFGPNGEVSLTNYNGAIYDDTRYNINSTTGSSNSSASHQPSTQVPSQSLPPGAMQNNSHQSQTSGVATSSIGTAEGPYVVNTPASGMGASYVQQQNVSQGPISSYSTGLQHTNQATQADQLFHVKAPSNAYPGMQLRVQNPFSGQAMIVTIPNGVQPGGMFAVR